MQMAMVMFQVIFLIRCHCDNFLELLFISFLILCLICWTAVKWREQHSCRVSEELPEGSFYYSPMLARKWDFCQFDQGVLSILLLLYIYVTLTNYKANVLWGDWFESWEQTLCHQQCIIRCRVNAIFGGLSGNNEQVFRPCSVLCMICDMWYSYEPCEM